MDAFDLKPERKKKGSPGLTILAMLILLGAFIMVGFFVAIFINPYVFFNPFPPEAIPTALEFPTATPTLLQLPATWTSTPTLEPPPTSTLAATWTPQPSDTPFLNPLFTPTKTPIPTKSAVPTGAPYSHTMVYQASTYYHPDAGCNWLGVAGQVLDQNNSPVLFITVVLGGYLPGVTLDTPIVGMSGTVSAYGQSGFEFVLADKTIISSKTLWIQLKDQSDQPLTEQIYFDTKKECDQNLVLFRFKKVH